MEKSVILRNKVDEDFMYVFVANEDVKTLSAINLYFRHKTTTPFQKELLRKEFMAEHTIDPDTIVAHGYTDVSGQFASKYIEFVTLPSKFEKRLELQKAYKCFANKDVVETINGDIPRWMTNKDNCVLHEDASGAWNCAMGTIGNPKSGYIQKLKK